MSVAIATITLDDFITGLVAGLAKRDRRIISIRNTNFYGAVIATFTDLQSWAKQNGADVDFWLAQNPFHGDSPDVRNGLTRAVQDDLISLDNPTYQRMRIQITPSMADDYLRALAGGSSLYEHLTDRFLQEYTQHS